MSSQGLIIVLIKRGVPFKRRVSFSPGTSPVCILDGRSMLMTAGNVSNPSQLFTEKVIYWDGAPEEPAVIQPRKGPVKVTSSGSG